MSETSTGLVPASQNDGSGTAMSLILDPVAMGQITSMAELMSSSQITVPKHLQGNKGDCMAIILQAARWKMDPFAVAKKTHVSQSGALGYEAQLVNAVIVSCGAITSQPEFEFVGDWDKILGRVVEKVGRNGGKYFAADWSAKDEEGLGVIVSATLAGEARPRSIKIMLTQCYPRFSTQWATDPQQQITYVGVNKFARRYAPGAIMGVYTREELESEVPEEIDVTPKAGDSDPSRQGTGKQEATKKPEPVVNYCPPDRFKKLFPKFKAAIEKRESTAQDIYDFLKEKGFDVSDEQRKSIEEIKPPIQGEATVVDDQAKSDMPAVTFAQLAEKLNAATTIDALDEACDLIGEVSSSEQRKELGELYDNRRTALEAN